MIKHCSCSYDDPFNHPIGYSPTDRAEIDRNLGNARRLLTPHTLLISMLHSRFQAVRYRHSGLILLLLRLVLRSCQAFESMRCENLAQLVWALDIYLILSILAPIHLLEKSGFLFYSLGSKLSGAVAWIPLRNTLSAKPFTERHSPGLPLDRSACILLSNDLKTDQRHRWSFGANRVQFDADVRLLNAFLDAVQQDGVRADHLTTSLTAERHSSRASGELFFPYTGVALLNTR